MDWEFGISRCKLLGACVLCLTLCSPTDCSLPASSVRGIILAEILEWIVISSSMGSS